MIPILSYFIIELTNWMNKHDIDERNIVLLGNIAKIEGVKFELTDDFARIVKYHIQKKEKEEI